METTLVIYTEKWLQTIAFFCCLLPEEKDFTKFMKLAHSWCENSGWWSSLCQTCQWTPNIFLAILTAWNLNLASSNWRNSNDEGSYESREFRITTDREIDDCETKFDSFYEMKMLSRERKLDFQNVKFRCLDFKIHQFSIFQIVYCLDWRLSYFEKRC